MDNDLPEFSLEFLTDGEIQNDMDLSKESPCRASLLNVSSSETIYINCSFPDIEWVHAVYNGHLGRDSKGRSWTWNEDGVDLVENTTI